MIRPWYRSRLLWLGLPVLVSLLWSWADSRRFRSRVSWQTPNRFFVLEQRDSCLGFGWVSSPVFADGAGDFDWGREEASKADPFYDPSEPPPPIFRPPFGHWISTVDQDSKSVEDWEVAWWVVVSAFTFVWLGTLVIWQRRKLRFSATR